MTTGIISYGVYIPQFRIRISDIASFWGRNGTEIEGSLGIQEKALASLDQDATTMAIDSALTALSQTSIQLDQIKALAVGSESHPYAVKPTSTIVGEILGIPHNYLAIDTQFACKAATTAMRLISMMDELDEGKYGLVIGSDTAQAKPGDALEYTAASAAVSIVLGKGDSVIATIINSTSYSSDTPDFWRRDGQKFPSHAGRFTGEPAYFHHVLSASTHLLEKAKMKPSDFDYAVFHMPNAKFPKIAAKKLGFSEAQIKAGLTVEQIGNPYSASSMLGLSAVLDIAKPNQKIFVCSYGSGSGSDAFILQTTKKLIEYQKKQKITVAQLIKNKHYISYNQMLKILIAKGYIKV